jgi:hypothetical protein
MKIHKKPIFIHSLFRTGSTYIWNKFRENPNYYCYYEPFHQILAQVTPKNIEYALSKNYDRVKHPHLTRYYLYEYRPLLENEHSGVPYFKKSFSFDEFCYNGENPDLKNYIDYLITRAGDKIPLLQFNRSALRVKWFKQNYPDSLNIYLVRNPRDQWESYVQLYRRSNYTGFFLMDLIIAGINKDKNDFLPLANRLPLLRYRDDQQDNENNFYHLLLDSYSQEEKYLIFYYTWFRSLVENVLNADFILNINLLSKESSYREKVIKFLKNRGIHNIDFTDAGITEYSMYDLAAETMDNIEENVRGLSIRTLTGEQIDRFFQAMPREDKDYFRFRKEDFIRIGKEKNKTGRDTWEKTVEKFEKTVSLFADKLFSQIHYNKQLDDRLKQTDLQIENKDKELREKDLLLAEKDERIAEKDYLISKEDRKLQRKARLLSRKNEQLKQKDKIIEEKDRLLAETGEQLDEKSLQISEIKGQVLQLEQQLEKLRRSYTYRTGKIITAPLKAAKKLFSRRFKEPIPIPIHVEKYEKKVNLADQLNVDFGRHRSGWIFAVRNLKVLHNPHGVLLDSFIERTFSWHPQGIKPHLRPWIGFIHVPPQIPGWFSHKQTIEVIFNSEAWKESLPHCRGLFTLSAYHRKYLEGILDIPVNNLLFPTEISHLKWNWDKFTANKEKKIVQVGWWLRKLHAIYQLPLPKKQYEKIFLSVGHKNLPQLLEKEREILLNEGTFVDEMYETAETVSYLSDHEYDRLLAENIVFVFLYDASANNTVIECIARNTPILINPLEAVKEYLGDDYPLYYNSLEEAAEKALDLDLIYKTHRYLIDHPIKPKLTGKYFLTSFADSQIYRGLKPNPFE